MYILTVKGRETDGAYSVINADGEQILYLFVQEDDAIRYALLLEEDEYPEMHVIELEDEAVLTMCEIENYKYTIITPNDIVIPPKDNDYFSED
jgi:hypothetical protein|tara:strand:- start:129 stop:407 length:279 start_codon:yes stop_codon:yes gene_type:complete